MLAANTELEIGATAAPALGSDPDELSYPLDVQRDEGIDGKDAAGGILAQEAGAVVAADAEGRLGEIIGAEGKEFRTLSNGAGAQSGARQFDHGANEIL